MSETARPAAVLFPPPWELSDEKLLAQCRIDSYVASGPGGQKRHKTNAAVRITHEPTRIVATATDSRSHRENHIHALRNLRHKLAMELRREITDPTNYRPPAWFADYPGLFASWEPGSRESAHDCQRVRYGAGADAEVTL